jgi:3D (Asp-Asp-Asp) domain-containing protein
MSKILRGIAILNELTNGVLNDYYIRTVVIGTLYHDDIIARLNAKQIATLNVDGSAFVINYFNECALAVSEGYNVVTDFFHVGIGTHGVILSQDLGHNIPANRLDVRMNFTQGTLARTMIADTQVYVEEQPAAKGPDVQNVVNPTRNEANVLNIGAMVLVKGLRIAIRGDKTDEIGVYFTSEDGATTVRVSVEHISPNTPTRLQFVLPSDVYEGNWLVSVRTQSTGSSTIFSKEVREFHYPYIIQVVI